MPVKRSRKSPLKRNRRRLQPSRNTNLDYAPLQPARNIVRAGVRTVGWFYNKATRKWQKMTETTKKAVSAKVMRQNVQAKLATTDNITMLPPTIVSKKANPSQYEKIAKFVNPSPLIKRNFQWSSEASSGRKGWFSIHINNFSSLVEDLNKYREFITDTNVTATTYPATGILTGPDPTINTIGQADRKQMNIDYVSNKISMLNSGTNPIVGKIHVYTPKRDLKVSYQNVGVINTPINHMMYASANALPQYNESGTVTEYQGTVGNGFLFDNATAGVSYNGDYQMPGSTLNTGGATAQTDILLSPESAHIKDWTDYYFNKESSHDFNLKPGQQLIKWFKMSNNRNIQRQDSDFEFVKGVSYYLVVEFYGGIVGSAIATNTISTGSAQLSCIREEKRVITLLQRTRPKALLMTPPLAGILQANQMTINPDSGIQDTGYEEDS